MLDMGPAKNKAASVQGPVRTSSQSSASDSVFPQTKSDLELVKQVCRLLDVSHNIIDMYTDLDFLFYTKVVEGKQETADNVIDQMHKIAGTLKDVSDAIEYDYGKLTKTALFEECGSHIESFAQLVTGVQLFPRLALDVKKHVNALGLETPAAPTSEDIERSFGKLVKCQNANQNKKGVSWKTCVEDCTKHCVGKEQD